MLLFPNVGKVIEGQETLDNLYKGYGDMPPFGEGPDQQQLHQQGNAYIRSLYPKIDFLNTCSLIDSEPEAFIDQQQQQQQDHSEFEPEDDDDKKASEVDHSAEEQPQHIDSEAAAEEDHAAEEEAEAEAEGVNSNAEETIPEQEHDSPKVCTIE